jgi:hypothetical protein
MLNLYRFKIILPLIIAFSAIYSRSNAQGMNHPFYDFERKYHFGFMLGTNFSNFKYDFSKAWPKQDSVKTVKIQKFPGITLAAVGDLHLGEYFDIRLIPTLILTQRNILYQFANVSDAVPKQIESALVDLPLLIKMKSERHQNLRFYVIGGGSYAYDLASNAGAQQNPADPIVALKPGNLSWNLGQGWICISHILNFHRK